MGGQVALTIKKDNELKNMQVRTGEYNWLLMSKESNFGDQDLALKDFCKSYDEMAKKYSPNHTSSSMAPSGYGLVFIDYDTKQIQSLQGYDTPGSIILTYFSKYLNHESSHDHDQLILHNKVKIKIYKESYDLQEIFETTNPQEILNQIKELANNSGLSNNPNNEVSKKVIAAIKKKPNMNLSCNDCFFISFELKEWNVTCYDESIKGLLEFFNNVKHHLNAKDVLGWKEEAKNYLEDFWDETAQKMQDNKESEEKIESYLNIEKREILKLFKLPKARKKAKP